MFARSFTFISGAPACPRAPFLFSSRTFSFQATRFAQSPARQVSKPKAKHTSKQKQQSASKPTTTPAPKTRHNTVRKEFGGLGRGSKVLIELERKVMGQKEVVLFKASSQRAYIFGAYGIAAFAFSYAIINSSLGIQEGRVELATWQKVLYVGMCIVMSGMGTVFVGRTGRLIKNITAVNSHGKILINVTVRSMIPFRKPYTITVPPGQITFSRQLAVGSQLQPGEARTEKIKISWFKEPLRAVNFAFFRLFISVRRIFTQEDFVMMNVQGYKGAFRLGTDGYVSKELLAIGGIKY